MAVTGETLAEKSGGPAGEGAGLGVSLTAGGVVAGPGVAGPVSGAGVAPAGPPPSPQPARAPAAATSARRPRWSRFRVSGIRQGKAIGAALVTQS
ncbi:hypothetical protein Sru01_26240 [Sphaerisporangium rufum]|uniref:Uncharacterized protein n=1 Tax=Sphaerisporangium rufum TaxID=1381558 RepID=A0A919R0X9_9ACTN|nr:hypothetical protein Sru01_26240 [Sphaerisporangium rufum]